MIDLIIDTRFCKSLFDFKSALFQPRLKPKGFLICSNQTLKKTKTKYCALIYLDAAEYMITEDILINTQQIYCSFGNQVRLGRHHLQIKTQTLKYYGMNFDEKCEFYNLRQRSLIFYKLSLIASPGFKILNTEEEIYAKIAKKF
ncbi:hypothetical protein BpHYR1_002815 [Brachionus plicatilis]|uniref:Uncharacterized protein n=1 Tax=Brachionus plicatilis TaxID=10195 RepID=A0A3M7PPV5_BRAPC|nr:hypothetical protein BpHYR1_002815 [Brachionus plicatilis]